MNMKEAHFKAEIREDENGVTVIFKVIKSPKGYPKEFLKVLITPDRITADLNEESYFALESFSRSKIDAEIAC